MYRFENKVKSSPQKNTTKSGLLKNIKAYLSRQELRISNTIIVSRDKLLNDSTLDIIIMFQTKFEFFVKPLYFCSMNI